MKSKAVLWTIIGCLAAGGITGFVLWKRHQNARELDRKQAELDAVRQAATVAQGPSVVTAPKQPSWAKNALYMAARGGDLDTMKKVLDEQPERLDELSGGMRATMLHIAAYKGNTAVVEELLKRGAKVNLQTKQGHTPLYDCIAAQGTVEIATMLLDHGADVTIAANDTGKTPLQLATDNGRTDFADLLRQHGAKK